MIKVHTGLETADCRRQGVGPAAVLRSQSGQSLLLALAVMFLLVFIGGVFIGVVGRNIMRAQRSGEVISVQYLAEAGIRYADHQLTYSEQGADWRPVPEYPDLVRHLERGDDITSETPMPNPDDPDYTWLMQGFTRYTYGKGRFLLRVTYRPKPDDPMSKYIKIESIGRMGVVDPNDPTTYQTKQPIRLRKELVAYKPIAITDYARFITNKDRRSTAAALGAPGFITAFGEVRKDPDGNDVFYGAPIRVNGDLIWHGRNLIWLDSLKGQAVEVAGSIFHEDSMGGAASMPAGVRVSALTSEGILVGDAVESSLNSFLTTPMPSGDLGKFPSDIEMGWYRDGNSGEDAGGRPRQITRLEPPNLDAIGVSGRLSRYRELTRNSGEWRQYTDPDTNVTTWYNTGYYGWGEGIYIDNNDDVQRESIGYTLRADWTQPGSSEFWHGPYYAPPGVTIEIFPYDLDNADGDNNPETGPDLRITRSDDTRYVWKNADGRPMSETGEQIIMPYPSNGIIFAEGNIRVKGMLARCNNRPPDKRQQLTIVSGATIYIEGSILKYRDPITGEVDDTCSVALLAEDYVCVNTTQFFGPLKEVPYPGPGSSFFDVSPVSAFWFNFAFGENPTEWNNGNDPVPVELFVRHASAPGGASYMNMLINWPPPDAVASANPYHSFYKFSVGGEIGLSEYIYPLGHPQLSPAYASQQYESWEHAVFLLLPAAPEVNGLYDLDPRPGVENRIGLQLDQSGKLPTPPQDYYVSRVAVLPMDVKIEAILYAQNNSFFIIPGEWFNPDPEDVCSYDQAGIPTPLGEKRLTGSALDPKWPFHGEPIDLRIEISGAISENMPASVGDASSWMEKWGWIPIMHGNSGELTRDYRSPLDPDDPNCPKRKGLTIKYDNMLSHPVEPARGTNPPHPYARQDEFGRPLPIAPKLPVSPQILYMGKPS